MTRTKLPADRAKQVLNQHEESLCIYMQFVIDVNLMNKSKEISLHDCKGA